MIPAGLEPGWIWAIGGVLLLIAEIVAPGFFLVFVGAAAIVTGLFALLFPLGLAAQLLLFALYAVVAVMAGRKIYARAGTPASDPHLNDRSARLIGRSVLVTRAIDGHGGRVRVGDGEWSARGGPADAGDQVRIVAVEGNCLIVTRERLSGETNE
ncbi:NfeD family protein [Sphingomonas ginkgonis]|uniref:NfeD family protein n=1 Tax=Sphingomonas ginkgonis TaxID=2315330 RepID=A0A429VAM0_9SPHN|nr:NfeD family protein [Sphingomonas ginkgonis]RST30996.1 NfeD family protein [Sphingomonas ginkgonis]